MPPRKKSGKITLRMDPQIHASVAKAAKALGMDINGLLNLIIREGIVRYESEAELLRKAGEMADLFSQWRYLNPSRATSEFFQDYYRIRRWMLRQTGSLPIFEDGNAYLVSGGRFAAEVVEQARRKEFVEAIGELRNEPTLVELVRQWEKLNPSRTVFDFFDDFVALKNGLARRFPDGKYYQLDVSETEIIETPGGGPERVVPLLDIHRDKGENDDEQ